MSTPQKIAELITATTDLIDGIAGQRNRLTAAVEATDVAKYEAVNASALASQKASESATFAQSAQDSANVSTEAADTATIQASKANAERKQSEAAAKESIRQAVIALNAKTVAEAAQASCETDASRAEVAALTSEEHASKLEGMAAELVRTQTMIASLHPLF